MDRRNFLVSLGLGAAVVGTAHAESFSRPPLDKPPPVRDRKLWRDALAAARSRHIARLSLYRDVGRFPLNHRVLGSVPTFIDHRGVPCAVGHLMQQSNHAPLAANIAAANNNIYIEEIESGPAHEWILFSGLTREECALIQPSYEWRRPRPPIPRPPRPEPEPPHPEQETLRQHFVLVERRLRGDTEASLRIAMARLSAKIDAGARLDLVTP